MAPEFPADLIVLDLRLDGSELVGKFDAIERLDQSTNERLRVSWNAQAQPDGFFSFAGGAVYVANKPKTDKPDSLGNGQYAWVYNTPTDLMVVLVFPLGYVPESCEPYPEWAKSFQGRLTAYWRFSKGHAQIRWTMRQSKPDVTSEVTKLNRQAIRNPKLPTSGVILEDAGDKMGSQLIITILVGVACLAFLMFLIFYGPRDLPEDYKPIVRFIAALTGGLLGGRFCWTA
jgi:hypothetical protein